ncbi:MAG: riboflavin synthase [Pseudomonadota bacterium]
MFTGIVQELGKIKTIAPLKAGWLLEVSSQLGPFQLGESIAVDGVCLTVTKSSPEGFFCELSPETLFLTLAQKYQEGSVVNLERALSLGDRMGGHWVTGHVDKVISLTEKEVFNEFWKLGFSRVPENIGIHLVHKGSIALNGVSLTLNSVSQTSFEVMIIPHTLEKTNLKLLEVGDEVNVEVDWMSKLIVQTVERIVKGKHE